jgi:radical SAM protein with 4Fe4S-binding SPASM domain
MVCIMSRRLDVLNHEPHPRYVVWEITLRCDLACTHCGSRAGPSRERFTGKRGELTTAEALEVVGQLAAMGTSEVVLIGGEAYLHDGFLEIIAALKEAGITPVMTTGGRGVTAEMASNMAAAGMARVSVSIDGLRETHDRMRAWRGSFDAASNALDYCKAAGIRITANSNFNRLNMGELEPLFEHLRSHGIEAWQIQLTTPLGRAADRTDLTMQPYDLLDFVPRVAAIKQQAQAHGITLMPGNNLGYFGPEEALLRSPKPGGKDHWIGCQAGKFVMGIESDGAVKGCPSLQTSHYVGGNLLEQPIQAIWDESDELRFTRTRTLDDLWGFCRSCPFAEPCRGGCSFTAHALLGRPGNNPYCHFRAKQFAKEGKRERLVPKDAASGMPFDNGTFEIVVEPLDAPDPGADLTPKELVQITRRPVREV